jgi:hypothetical protein
MLIYLDTMLIQYISDYFDYIYQDVLSQEEIPNPANEPKLAAELAALRRLVFIEQFFDWVVAAPSHLMSELLSGKPNQSQVKTYKTLFSAWKDSSSYCGESCIEPDEDKIQSIHFWLESLNLRDKPDRRNLAEAMALQASWFLTNDKNIINRAKQKLEEVKNTSDGIRLFDYEFNINQILKKLLMSTKVSRPSEFIVEIEAKFIFP